MLHDPQSDAARRRDLAVICGDREPVGGLDATIAACDALNRAGVTCDDESLLGDALVEDVSGAGVLPTDLVVDVRRLLLARYPGLVSREPVLVAF